MNMLSEITDITDAQVPASHATQASSGQAPAATLPTTLALVEDDLEYAEYLAQYLNEQGVDVRRYGDSNDLLADRTPYDYGFYLLDLTLPGVDGVELIRILRKRTTAGIIVVTGRRDTDVFERVMEAGADMHLSKPVRFEQVTMAIKAVQRRSSPNPVQNPGLSWKLDTLQAELLAPDGTRIGLSGTDMAVMECLLEAQGAVVSKNTLNERLGRPLTEGPDNGLNATIYRLRRRIEQATPLHVPLHSQSRKGYQFRAPLVRV
ncbi:response regulator transcription factor [Curvibacter lanceolatus]|jgi:DNA-binding response OmpR family regulator|uniref:response regulator transcription factor n=1 Tax=Curvibacter lanceolatus TaxID=86182 RepID=UPI00036EF3B0|nr:response regulator transcription factor [Curvibacter lanceolatus]